MIVRLQKYIADCQVASRRAAEILISEGKVTVNGSVVTEQGVKVDTETDIVEYNGKKLTPADEKVYIMLHKPEGYVTSNKDQFGRPDVAQLVADIPARLFPVGRLDFDTSGLLLMTNDGDLAYKLTHPKHMIDKVYIARVAGKPDEAALGRLRAGVDIGDYKTAAAEAMLVRQRDGSFSVKITIREGKNRQVRRMLEAVGHRVLELKRVATGRLYLGELPRGQHRRLTGQEIKYLQSL